MISVTTEGELGPARDLDAKFDKLMSMIEGSEKRMAQEMQAIKLAVDAIRPDITAAAPALGVGSPNSGPGSSATSGASPAVPDAKLVFAIDTTSLGAPLPTRCSTECPSSDASALVTLEAIPLTATTPLEVTATELIALGLVSGLSNIGHLSGLQLKPPWPSWIGSDGVDMHQLAKFLFKQNYIGEQTKLQGILVQVSITNLAMQLINYHADHDAQIGMETSSVSRELYVINLYDAASFALQRSSSDVEKSKCLSRDFHYLWQFNIDSLFPWNPGGCLPGYSSRGLNFPCSYSIEESCHGILGIVMIQDMLMAMGSECFNTKESLGHQLFDIEDSSRTDKNNIPWLSCKSGMNSVSPSPICRIDVVEMDCMSCLLHIPAEMMGSGVGQPLWQPPQISTIWLSCRGIHNRRQIELKPWPDGPQHQCIGGCVDLLFTCTAAVYSEYGIRFRQAFSVDMLPGQYHWQIAWPSQVLELNPAAVLTLGAMACYLHKRRLCWVKQWCSDIQEVQQVSVFLDISVGFGSCATGIPKQIFGTCSLMKLLSICSAHVPMENFVDVGNRLKCKEGMQRLFGEILVQITVRQNASVCCFMRISDKEEKIIGTTVGGAFYLAWLSEQEERIPYAVVVKDYYEPKHRRGHQRKELPGIDAVRWIDLGVLIYLSWCALGTWSPPVLLSSTYWLLLGHVQALDMQLLVAVLSGYNTSVSEPIFTEFQQLHLYKCLLNQAVATHLRVNPMELFTGDAASTRCGCAVLQCIIIGVPNYHHCSSMRDQSGEHYCFLGVSEHVTRFSLELIHFGMATCHGKMVSNQRVIFGLVIHLKQLLGLWLFDLEPWNPDEQNSSSPHSLMVPACKCSTFQGGKNGMARATCYFDFAGHDYYRDAFFDRISIGYNYYPDQVYYLDKVCSDLIYYRGDYHSDAYKIKELHAPWDPGKSALRDPTKTSAWGQAEFLRRGECHDLRLAYPKLGLCHGPSMMGSAQTNCQELNIATYMHQDATQGTIRMDHEPNGGFFLPCILLLSDLDSL